MNFNKIVIILILIIFSQHIYAQERTTDVEKPVLKYLTWTIVQLIPSPTWLNDRNANSSSLTFALRWQITPLNFSFSTNKFVSPVQFFFVNPMRRYTGSVEFFVQPELATGSFGNSGFNKMGIAVGSRFNIPLKNYGENLYMSLGGKYTFRKNNIENKNGYYGVEGGVYAIFGVLGLQFNYNFNNHSKYNFGIYIKYW